LTSQVDTLEVMLREVLDLVEKIFLVENTVTHRGAFKPLLWERLKITERFSFVPTDLVRHVVVDGGDHKMKGKTDWWYEREQTRVGVQSVKSWAAEPGNIDPDDLFVSGNADEVISRAAIHSLLNCHLVSSPVTGALWFPLGDPNLAFKSDFPVKGHPYTFAMPAIFRWSDFSKSSDGWRFTKATTAGTHYVQGGVHLSNPSFLPNALLKELTATTNTLNLTKFFNLNHKLEELDRQQELLHSLANHQNWKKRTVPVSSVKDLVAELPWWLKCNPYRFPYWQGWPDPRNKQLLEAMQAKNVSGDFDVAKILSKSSSIYH